jgi:F-type H+-transporting ATPase subunit b
MIVPSLATFLVTIVNITVLFFVLRAILFKPVTKFMEDRTNKVQDSLDRAEKERTQAKALLKQYEDQLQRIDAEATELLRVARDNARAEADRIVAEGKAQAALLLEKGRKQLEAEQRAAMTVFRADATALALNAAGRIIRRELTSDDNYSQADLVLEELTEGAAVQEPGHF